jgi:prepilin-type N-terminal cleavage/methylation domain-containing protein
MKKLSKYSPFKQSGFTLVELIIVIVIIGILSAVAVIKMTNVTDAANKAANKAVLGMVKSAWSAAYAVTKATPTATTLVAQTGDPVCTGATSPISCPVAWLSGTGAAGSLSITIADFALPNTISCTTPADCD